MARHPTNRVPGHIFFDIWPIPEAYYSFYEECVNIKPRMILAVGRMGSAVEIKKEVSGMISFLLCLAILIGGYFVYGKIVDNTFGPDDRETRSEEHTSELQSR